MDQKITGLIPGQGVYISHRFNHQSGHIWDTTNQCFSLTSVFLSFSKKEIKHILKKEINHYWSEPLVCYTAFGN